MLELLLQNKCVIVLFCASFFCLLSSLVWCVSCGSVRMPENKRNSVRNRFCSSGAVHPRQILQSRSKPKMDEVKGRVSIVPPAGWGQGITYTAANDYKTTVVVQHFLEGEEFAWFCTFSVMKAMQHSQRDLSRLSAHFVDSQWHPTQLPCGAARSRLQQKADTSFMSSCTGPWAQMKQLRWVLCLNDHTKFKRWKDPESDVNSCGGGTNPLSLSLSRCFDAQTWPDKVGLSAVAQTQIRIGKPLKWFSKLSVLTWLTII